jgi:hypothetical protein
LASPQVLAGQRRRRVDELVNGGSDGLGSDRTDRGSAARLALLTRSQNARGGSSRVNHTPRLLAAR